MINRLEPIIAQKLREVEILKNRLQENSRHTIARILREEISPEMPKNFKQALVGPSVAVIAEIKRRSPSNGPLATIADPILLAQTYVEGGANAISVLTEEAFFDGRLQDLEQVSKALSDTSIPILRKDFIIDEVQIAESIAAGANAILCVVLALGEKTKTILDRARQLGIAVLVEVIDEAELEIAISAGAEMIGINNRNLRTFEVDPERAMRLVNHIPNYIIKVAASGITDPQQAQEYYRAGFNAVLIGEALVKAKQPSLFIKACQQA